MVVAPGKEDDKGAGTVGGRVEGRGLWGEGLKGGDCGENG